MWSFRDCVFFRYYLRILLFFCIFCLSFNIYIYINEIVINVIYIYVIREVDFESQTV